MAREISKCKACGDLIAYEVGDRSVGIAHWHSLHHERGTGTIRCRATEDGDPRFHAPDPGYRHVPGTEPQPPTPPIVRPLTKSEVIRDGIIYDINRMTAADWGQLVFWLIIALYVFTIAWRIAF